MKRFKAKHGASIDQLQDELVEKIKDRLATAATSGSRIGLATAATTGSSSSLLTSSINSSSGNNNDNSNSSSSSLIISSSNSGSNNNNDSSSSSSLLTNSSNSSSNNNNDSSSSTGNGMLTRAMSAAGATDSNTVIHGVPLEVDLVEEYIPTSNLVAYKESFNGEQQEGLAKLCALSFSLITSFHA